MRESLVDLSKIFEDNSARNRLAKSTLTRKDLIRYFGSQQNIPSSVMKAGKVRTPEHLDEHGRERGYEETAPNSKTKHKTRFRDENGFPLAPSKTVSGKGCASGAISPFWQDVGRSVLLFYTKAGDIVFDPFAGHNSRMDLCVNNGRHYFASDVCKEFMEFNFKRAKQLRKKYKKAKIELHHGDSRKVPFENEIADFTITSPPYWDIEYYGEEEEQLGTGKTYKQFLKGLRKVLEENFRVLKPGAFAAWFVNDFRRKGVFYPYHIDTAKDAEKAGFIFNDIMIVDLGRGFRDVFSHQAFQQKVIPKRHEYALIFKKPENKNQK